MEAVQLVVEGLFILSGDESVNISLSEKILLPKLEIYLLSYFVEIVRAQLRLLTFKMIYIREEVGVEILTVGVKKLQAILNSVICFLAIRFLRSYFGRRWKVKIEHEIFH